MVLKTGKVGFFQLRLKSYSQKKKIIIGEKIKNICKKNKVKFIINDDPLLALKLNADGCHLGQKDMNIKIAKKILCKKIIGITCHNSMNLARKAIKAKADYIAFGAFNKSNTKKTEYVASVNILNRVKKFNVKFLVNDDVLLAKKLNADGCHLGQKDMNIFKARKIFKVK